MLYQTIPYFFWFMFLCHESAKTKCVETAYGLTVKVGSLSAAQKVQCWSCSVINHLLFCLPFKSYLFHCRKFIFVSVTELYVTFVSLKQRGMLVENNHSISLVAHFVMLQPYSELMDYIYFSPQEFYTQHPLITFFLSEKGLLVRVCLGLSVL